MKSVAKAGFFALFGCQSLHRLQIEVVIQVQIVQVLTVDQEVEHIIALAAYLQTDLNPIQLGTLKKLRRFQ